MSTLPDREPPKGWPGRDVPAGSTGSILPRPSRNKSVCANCWPKVESSWNRCKPT